MLWLVLPLLVLLAFLTLYQVGAARFRRRRALAGLALRWQMRFHPTDRQELLDKLGPMHLFHLGHSRRAYNIIQGRRSGYQVWAFDYAYEVGARQRRSLERREVVACKLKQSQPALLARRDELFEPLGKFRDFQSVAEVGSQLGGVYSFRSDQPETAAVLLDRPWLGYLGQAPAAHAEINGKYLLLYCEKNLSAPQLMRLIKRAVRCAREVDLSGPCKADAPAQ